MSDMNVKGKNELAWSVPVSVEEIAEAGLHMEVEAPADARRSIAKVAALRDLPRLAASFDLTKEGTRVQLTGQVHARVGQTCVVTLEPIENDIEETVHLIFAPPGIVSGKGKEPPEPLAGSTIDLGAVIVETLILGIDPYPRKADAKFVPPPASEDGPHPFAALEKLKKRTGNRQQ
jgi:uncharacterized metal-binding protein YceD (DUF177 family)